MTSSLPVIVFIVIFGLLGIGLYGLLASFNLIKVIVALQLLVKGILIVLIMAGHQTGKIELSQSMALTVIVVDTIVAVLGLVLAVRMRRHFGSFDIKAISTLRR
ncbi:MAG: NADH-quinone oxidoreductase subunit K [Anaerolineae bacterium]